MPVRRRRSRGTPAAHRGHGPRVARLRPRCRAGPALRLPGARSLRARAGLRFNPAKLLVDPYARAIDRVPEWDDAIYGYTRGAGRHRGPARLGGPRAVVGRGRCLLPLGRRPPAAHAVARDRHLRDPRPGLHRPASRRARGPAGDLRGARPPGRGRAPDRARRHRGRAAPRAPLLLRAPPRRARACATTGATTRSGTSRRTPATRRRGAGGEQVREFKALVRTLHAAGDRGDPRRRLQPHGRGRSSRARP